MTTFTLAQISALCGITNDVLRKWEARYGFPLPARDARGQRVYDAGQAHRLLLIRQLLDAGSRPAQVVPLGVAELEVLAGRGAAGAAQEGLLDGWLRTRDPLALRDFLAAELGRAGLEEFVCGVLPRLNREVGDGWARQAIAVRDEHLYTELVQQLLRSHMPAPRAEAPVALLATPPGEQHLLGLLMLEAVLALRGMRCHSLGADVPAGEIALAAREYGAAVVALSFSAAFPLRRIHPWLKALREDLPAGAALWAGGAGVARLTPVPRGVTVLSDLREAARLAPVR